MDRKEFTYNGHTAVVDKITLQQALPLLKLIKTHFADFDLDDLDPLTVVEQLLDRGILAEALSVALGGEADQIDWNQVPLEDILDILTFFLQCNAGLAKQLAGFLNVSVTLIPTADQHKNPEKASTA